MSDDPIISALARLEAGQADTTGRLVRLEMGQTNLRAEMESGFHRTDASMAGLRTGMAAFRSGVMDELGKTRGAIMDKMTGLQGSLDAIRDDITVNMGGVEAARQTNDNTRADVKQMREQMSVMWTQIKRLESRLRDITGDP